MDYMTFIECVNNVATAGDSVALDSLLLAPNLFTPTTVFWGNSWQLITSVARTRGIQLEEWPLMLGPALFLAISEISSDQLEHLSYIDTTNLPEHFEAGALFQEVRRRVRLEIERDIFDGITLYQLLCRQEESWPEDDYLYDISASANTEATALVNVVAEQVVRMLEPKDIEILLAEYGDGKRLAAKYDMSTTAIRFRKHWLIEKLQGLLA